MVNIMKLKGKIVENGLTIGQLADKIGVDRATLYRRFSKGGQSFTIKETKDICEALKLTKDEAVDIFFTNYVA